MCNKRKDSKMQLGRQPRAKNYNGSFLLHLAEIDLQGNGLTLIGYLDTQKQCFVSASGKYKMCLIIIFFFWLLIRCKKWVNWLKIFYRRNRHINVVHFALVSFMTDWTNYIVIMINTRNVHLQNLANYHRPNFVPECKKNECVHFSDAKSKIF